ncbi:MAG: hypothetical protein K8953_03605, partial [Proteobacteria bacterium]|nr:hypothetical protein [Pseudomonadota bacterium]
TDGFAYRAVNGLFLVGITETTDLGAPVDATTVLGTWKGSFVVGEFSGPAATFTPHDFTLAVTFGDTALGNAGSVASGTIGATGYVFAGEFDANGVISGTTTHTGVDSAPSNGAGVLQGLIGVKGAVGVFISDVGATKAYGGGFVAKPTPPPPPPACAATNSCVDYADWTASFDTGEVNASQPLRDSGYSNGVGNSSDYIKVTVMDKILSGPGGEVDLDTTILRLNETMGQDGYESGIAYAHDSVNTTGQTYVGILPTTNLGAPLADNSKNGTWTGSLKGTTGYNAPTLASDDFSLQVTYGGSGLPTGSAGTIKSLDGDDNVGFAPIIDANSASINGGIRFRGDFNADGVMWGTVNMGGAVDDNGTFSGLIGEKGGVGVFEGANPSFSYVGGFEVHPPSP